MATKTVWVTADCTRSSTVANSRGNMANFGNGANDLVRLVGDNAYDNGSAAEYAAHGDACFGAVAAANGGKDLRARMGAVPGNHEYHTADAAGFRSYFNSITSMMPALPRGGFAHQRGNSWMETVNGWDLLHVDTAGSSTGAYFVDAQASVWTAPFLAELDGWLSGAGKARLVFGHHMRFNPAASTGHGNMGGTDAFWQKCWNPDGTPRIMAWLGGHDHYLIATKPLNKAGGVATDPANGVQFFGSGAGAGSFDTPGTQPIKDFGQGSIYGYVRLTIPDMIGGEPQPITVDFYTTGNNGQATPTKVRSYTLDPAGTGPPPPPPGAPTVAVTAATAITDTSAQLNGTINPEGANVTAAHFDIGPTASYGSQIPVTPLPGSGTADVAVNEVASGLQAGHTYHYRLVATNSGGTSQSGDRTFTTTGGAVAGALLDDSFTRTVAPGGVGTADDGHTYNVSPTASWEANGDEAVAHLLSTANRDIHPVGLVVEDFEMVTQWNCGAPPGIADVIVTHWWFFRWQDTGNYYTCRVMCFRDGHVETAVQNAKAGSINVWGPVTSEPIDSVLGSRNFKTRLRVTTIGGGARLQARTWIAANVEPAAWDIDVTDPTPVSGAGSFWARTAIDAAPKSAIGFHIDNWHIDDLTANNPPPGAVSLSGCPPSGRTTSPTVVLNWPDAENAASYQKSENGGAWAAVTRPYTVTSPAVGQTKVVRVRAVGADGQTGPEASCSITRTVVAPSVYVGARAITQDAGPRPPAPAVGTIDPRTWNDQMEARFGRQWAFRNSFSNINSASSTDVYPAGSPVHPNATDLHAADLGEWSYIQVHVRNAAGVPGGDLFWDTSAPGWSNPDPGSIPTPKSVVAGDADAIFNAIFDGIKALHAASPGWQYWFCFHHEPEDDYPVQGFAIRPTAGVAFRAAAKHVHDLYVAKGMGPSVGCRGFLVTLMKSSFDPAAGAALPTTNRKWVGDYWPTTFTPDLLGLDAYLKETEPTFATFEAITQQADDWAFAAGIRVLVGEFGYATADPLDPTLAPIRANTVAESKGEWIRAMAATVKYRGNIDAICPQTNWPTTQPYGDFEAHTTRQSDATLAFKQLLADPYFGGTGNPIPPPTVPIVGRGGGNDTDTHTPTYTPKTTDVGAQIRSYVIPSNAQGQGGRVYTAWSPVVTAAVAAPTNTTPPHVNGSSILGSTLTADVGAWTGNPTGYDFRWSRDGSLIPGAEGQSYDTDAGADAGAEITVEVSAHNAGGTSSFVAADNSIVMDTTATPPTPDPADPPTITFPGPTPDVGEILIADPGGWSGTQPITFTYEWLRAAAIGGPYSLIPGAIGNTYTLKGGDLDLFFKVRVFAHNPASP